MNPYVEVATRARRLGHQPTQISIEEVPEGSGECLVVMECPRCLGTFTQNLLLVAGTAIIHKMVGAPDRPGCDELDKFVDNVCEPLRS